MRRRPFKEYSEEEIRAIEEKCKSIKQEIENPHNKEFHDKLKILLNAKADSRDNFINWLTGLTTGAIFFMLNKVSPIMDNRILSISIIAILFLTILSAVLFKVFLEVRYSSEELEVAMLKNIWEGYDITKRTENLMTQGRTITDEEKEKLYKNFEESIKYIDNDFLERSKKPITIKSFLLSFFYKSSVFLFLAGITLTIVYFSLIVFKPVTN
ncbi:MAG: hypothetical protein C4540_06315 [Candidatus Omnitrophota bacterium]|jgi:hypothetical protein|nr:MAG: hypothetical protein C4540_06315 [Candidatus Omnitrophota bacterium]